MTPSRPSGAGPVGLDIAGIHAPAATTTALSAAAGFVDAFVFLAVRQVFTANQSGNLILAGIALGERRWSAAAVPTLAVLGYGAGAAAGVLAFDRGTSGRPRLLGTLLLEAAALTVLAVVVGVADDVAGDAGIPHPVVLLAVGLASAAMGVQAVALRTVHHVGVLTTAGTGNVTSAGIGLARWITRRTPLDEGVGAVAAAVVAYVGGAAAGAAVVESTGLGAVALVAPIAVVLAILAFQLVLDARSGSPPGT